MLEIMPYNYNTLCDTNRCNNRAMVSLGRPGESPATYHNICNECLQDIVNQVPINMVLAREDVKLFIDEAIQEAMSDDLEAQPYEHINDVSKDPTEGDLDTTGATDYNELGVRELKSMAKDRGLTGYSNLNKDDLIELLEGSE